VLLSSDCQFCFTPSGPPPTNSTNLHRLFCFKNNALDRILLTALKFPFKRYVELCESSVLTAASMMTAVFWDGAAVWSDRSLPTF
jgi:hypothetical protein